MSPTSREAVTDVVHNIDCATQPEWLLGKRDPKLAGQCTCGAENKGQATEPTILSIGETTDANQS